MKKKLPSGAELLVNLAPFADAKDLSQAVLRELKDLKIDGSMKIDHDFIKNIICVALSSKDVEEKLWVCMKRASYNGESINEDTFEPEKAREDYIDVCREVASRNIMPFTKSLYAELSPFIGAMMPNFQA